MNEPRVLDLYTGAAGFALAFEHAGFEIGAMCEIDSEACRFLKHWFPGIPNVGNVRKAIPAILELGPFDVLTGGVPCTPTSNAGEMRGALDERWLWPETIDVIGAIRPRLGILENPAAILSLDGGRAFNGIASRLVSLGYDLWWEVLPAYAVGAGHRRERCLIFIADSTCPGLERYPRNDAGTGSKSERRKKRRFFSTEDLHPREIETGRWYLQSRLSPLVHGLPSGLVKTCIQLMGNAVVPQTIIPYAEAIKEILK